MLYGCTGVIFDFNGTLFFDSDKHVKAWNKLAEEIRGYGISEEELQNHFYGVPNNEAIKYLMQTHVSDEELTKYSRLKESYYREFCKEDIQNFHLVEGAVPFLGILKENGIPFTIASASIKENIDFFVETFGLNKWIQPENIIYDNGTYENKKMMFLDAAKVIGRPIEECLVFEDSESGIRDALAAGCKNIVVMDSMSVGKKYLGQQGIVAVEKDMVHVLV